MKTVLNQGVVSFNPTAKTLDFSSVTSFDPARVYAVINITRDQQIIYAVASYAQGFGGSWSGNVVTLTYNTTAHSAGDDLQIIYDNQYENQYVTGTVEVTTNNGPIDTDSRLHASDGTEIFATIDPITGEDGLNVHLQSSAYGGQLGSPLPSAGFGYQSALSMGFLNQGVLVTPKMDPATNELIVQANFAAASTQDVNITQVNGSAITSGAVPVDIASQSGLALETNLNIGGLAPATNAGSNTAQTLRTSSNIALNGSNVSAGLGANDAGTIRTAANIAFNGTAAQTGSGTINAATQRVVLATDQPIVSTDMARYGGASTSLGLKAAASSMPSVLSSDLATGSITIVNSNPTSGAPTAGSTVAVTSTGYSGAVIDIRGTYTGTIQFQGSIDGTNWITLQATPYGVAQNTALVSATTTGQTGAWLVNCPGTAQVRASGASAITGSATVNVRAVNSTGWVYSAPVGATNSVAIASGTVTTVSTVSSITTGTIATVSSVTASNSASALVTDVNGLSVVATGTSANITVSNQQSSSFSILYNYSAGTGSIDVTIQESYDNGSTWVDVYAFDRVSSTGTPRQNAPLMRLSNTLLRYNYVITGTVTTNALTIIRTHRAGNAPFIKRIYDRTLVPSTLSSSSSSLYTEGCEYLDLIVSMAAGGTAPVIQLQGSEDGTNWYNIGTSLTATVGATTSLNVTDGSLPRFIRANVATAGVGSTLNYIMLKAKGV